MWLTFFSLPHWHDVGSPTIFWFLLSFDYWTSFCSFFTKFSSFHSEKFIWWRQANPPATGALCISFFWSFSLFLPSFLCLSKEPLILMIVSILQALCCPWLWVFLCFFVFFCFTKMHFLFIFLLDRVHCKSKIRFFFSFSPSPSLCLWARDQYWYLWFKKKK